jgi:hypothetical protein
MRRAPWASQTRPTLCRFCSQGGGSYATRLLIGAECLTLALAVDLFAALHVDRPSLELENRHDLAAPHPPRADR